MSCDKSKIAPMCINCSRYRESIFMAVMQLAASKRQLLKMVVMFVLIGNCQNKGVKSQFFGECGKSKNVRRRKELGNADFIA